MALLRARLDLDVVGRVGVHQVDGGAVQQAIHVLGLAAVAAEQAVVAEEPQVARLRDRLVGRLGHVVGVGQALVRLRPEQPQQLVGGEAGQVQVEVHLLELGQLERQLVVVPARHRGRLVVGDAVRLGLRRRQADGHVDRDFFQAQLQRRLVARVADDDDALLIDDDRLAEAELLDRRRHGVHGGVVDARVVLVGPDRFDRTHFDVHGVRPSWDESCAGPLPADGSIVPKDWTTPFRPGIIVGQDRRLPRNSGENWALPRAGFYSDGLDGSSRHPFRPARFRFICARPRSMAAKSLSGRPRSRRNSALRIPVWPWAAFQSKNNLRSRSAVALPGGRPGQRRRPGAFVGLLGSPGCIVSAIRFALSRRRRRRAAPVSRFGFSVAELLAAIRT